MNRFGGVTTTSDGSHTPSTVAEWFNSTSGEWKRMPQVTPVNSVDDGFMMDSGVALRVAVVVHKQKKGQP
jgi:hypothetical protein